jgi:excinuclease ABC subunit C
MSGTGADIIKRIIPSIPPRPGVYQMINKDGKPIYIGKAKNLPNRLNNYTNASGLTNRIMRMISHIARVDVSITQSEAEALLLEATLIKQHQPRYNILLKDDKSFPYIVFTGGHDFARIKKHRGSKIAGDTHFGPFASAGAVGQAMDLLQKVFLLRNCSDTTFKNRKRPCLEYQIKRCTAPCVGYVSKDDYAQQVQMATDFLRGKSRDIQTQLSTKMQKASDAMDYEKAALLRDRIRALSRLKSSNQLSVSGVENADIIALARAHAHSVVQVYLFRDGQHFGHQTYYPSHDETADNARILEAFIGQFYHRHAPPNAVYINQDVDDKATLQEALSLKAGHLVKLHIPQKGDKKALLDRAFASANQALKLRRKSQDAIAKHHDALATLLGIKSNINRIEVFDNSHVMGNFAVGGMIVATALGFDKNAYRIFKFQDANITAGDDYGMMRHMLTRRLKRILATNDDTEKPDLMLIDGGKGQLSIALQVRNALRANIAMLAIAKGEDRNAGREWFHLENTKPFQLPPGDSLLHYLQNIRDEAHRFAITNHRKGRSKAISKSVLDDIPGIGAKRKRLLMHHFGARAGVEAASIAELMHIEGISQKTAQAIYDYFHGE